MDQPLHQTELQKTSPNESSYKKLRNCNPLEKKYRDYEKLINSGLSKESILTNLKFSEVPSTGSENYQQIEKVCMKKMQSFRDVLR